MPLLVRVHWDEGTPPKTTERVSELTVLRQIRVVITVEELASGNGAMMMEVQGPLRGTDGLRALLESARAMVDQASGDISWPRAEPS